MTHLKTNCSRQNLILANRCGLACANCGACKCIDDPRPTQELDTVEQLEQRRKLVWYESEDANKRVFGPLGGYSYPAHQLAAIDKRIKEISSL